MSYFFGASPEPQASNRKLRVRIGPSVEALQLANPNDETNPHYIDSPFFVGHVMVRIKQFHGATPDNQPPKQADEYFGKRKRLFALQVCGRFKHEYTADDVVFGAEFERPVSPPTGAWVAMKFANLIDPALQADIYCDKPWLYSPLLCAMNVIHVSEGTTAVTGAAPANPAGPVRVADSNESLHITGPDPSYKRNPAKEISKPSSAVGSQTPAALLGNWTWHGDSELAENNTLLVGDDAPFESDAIAERRKYFQKAKVRQMTRFTPKHIYNFEIFAPFIDLNTFDLTLGVNINLLRYLKDQPIRLMAKSQSTQIVFFVVEFDLAEETKT